MFFKFFNILFPKPPSQSKIRLRRNKLIKSLVCRFSRGNLHLKMGKYITKEEMDKLKE